MTTEVQLGFAQVVIGVFTLIFAPFITNIWTSFNERKYLGLNISAFPLTGTYFRSLEWMFYVEVNEKLDSKSSVEIFSGSAINAVSKIREVKLTQSINCVEEVNGIGKIAAGRLLPGQHIRFHVELEIPGRPVAYVNNVEIPIVINFAEMFRRSGEHFYEFQERLLIMAKWRILWLVSSFTMVGIIAISRIFYIGLYL